MRQGDGKKEFFSNKRMCSYLGCSYQNFSFPRFSFSSFDFIDLFKNSKLRLHV